MAMKSLGDKLFSWMTIQSQMAHTTQTSSFTASHSKTVSLDRHSLAETSGNRDVHFFTAFEVYRFLSGLTRQESNGFPRKLIRSLTFHLTNDTLPISAESSHENATDMVAAMKRLLETLAIATSLLPRVRTIRLEYKNVNFDSIFLEDHLCMLPGSAKELEVAFSFDGRTKGKKRSQGDVGRKMRESYQPTLEHIEWHLTGVYRLTVTGAPSRVVGQLARSCDFLGDMRTDVDWVDVVDYMPTTVVGHTDL